MNVIQVVPRDISFVLYYELFMGSPDMQAKIAQKLYLQS